jgi:hypothetical protein
MKLKDIVDDLNEILDDWGFETPDELFENFELNGKIFISKENRGNDRFSFYCGLSIDGGLSDTLKCSKYVIDSFTKIGLTCSPGYLDRNRRFDVNVSDDDFFYINKPLKGDYEGTLTALKNVFKADGFSIDEDDEDDEM